LPFALLTLTGLSSCFSTASKDLGFFRAQRLSDQLDYFERGRNNAAGVLFFTVIVPVGFCGALPAALSGDAVKKGLTGINTPRHDEIIALGPLNSQSFSGYQLHFREGGKWSDLAMAEALIRVQEDSSARKPLVDLLVEKLRRGGLDRCTHEAAIKLLGSLGAKEAWTVLLNEFNVATSSTFEKRYTNYYAAISLAHIFSASDLERVLSNKQGFYNNIHQAAVIYALEAQVRSALHPEEARLVLERHAELVGSIKN